VYGPNPDHNPQLANTLAAAKKTGVPKAVIEGAIARGQGRTSGGAALESLTYEAMVPPSVALIMDVETENKLRLMQDLNQIIKKAKGSASPSKFFFSRTGRVVFEKSLKENGPGADDIMDDAIEAGAEDIEEDEEGNIVVWTQPNRTTEVCRVGEEKHDLKILSSDIVWSPNEDTKVKLDAGIASTNLAELLAALQDYPDVQAVYSNVAMGSMSEEEWAAIEENMDV
jgi:transcriptional/translational regulatory protein YebC/TACO1